MFVCLIFIQCIGDAVLNTSLYVVLSSNSKQDVFSCDSINPYFINLSNNNEIISVSELSNEPNYGDSTCLRRWKLNGNNYLQNEIAICLDVLDSTLILDTIQILSQKEPALMLHIGCNSSFLGDELLDTVPLNWTNENYKDTLFVELTSYR